MIRRLAIALGASAIIAAGVLAPTAASAKSGKHHWNGRGGIYISLDADDVDSDCYIVRKVVWKHHRKHIRYVRVCD